MGRRDGSRSWGFAAAAVGLIVAGLAGLVWFLAGEGLERADQWAGVLGLLLAVLATVVPLVTWMVRRARSGPVPPPDSFSGSPKKFQVSAGRDAYIAEQMTVNRDGTGSSGEETMR